MKDEFFSPQDNSYAVHTCHHVIFVIACTTCYVAETRLPGQASESATKRKRWDRDDFVGRRSAGGHKVMGRVDGRAMVAFPKQDLAGTTVVPSRRYVKRLPTVAMIDRQRLFVPRAGRLVPDDKRGGVNVGETAWR